ncbi:MAG: S8 family serine peptidase, partial [Myxococcota bacterium]
MLHHDDLYAAGITLLSGVNKMYRSHGTSILGEVVAVDNAIGGIGIAPAASAHVVSQWRTNAIFNTADAIVSALAHLDYGDVLLLSAQTTQAGYAYLPVEVEPAVFDAIRLGTALGVTIIESAGNGSNDLDRYRDSRGHGVLSPRSSEFRDSGAIMVSAATATSPHRPMWFSNLGSRVNCFAWGEHVDTCASDTMGSVSGYTANFNGTSSAAAIIAGAAVVIQAMAEANLGHRFAPAQLRALLANPGTGTATEVPDFDRIGVMPDLRAIVASDELNLAPRIYLRSHIGDRGGGGEGAVATSPDIIVHASPVSAPQLALSPGDDMAGAVPAHRDGVASGSRYVYIRVHNRGGADGCDVIATVYWAPLATLVSPERWTAIGSIAIPRVPAGDVLTVSEAIPWPQRLIPRGTPYSLVAVIGSADEPALSPAMLRTWDDYFAQIRAGNRIARRSVGTVVHPAEQAGDEDRDPLAMPFFAAGAM